MLDVSLFRAPSFSAASGSVTLAFFALFGFIFLITQYFQFVRGYGTLSTGVRILPVAITIALGSVLGARLASRLGTRVLVVTGLLLLGTAFAWIAISPTYRPYAVIAAQMVLIGAGLGLATTPATESILSVLPAAKAGIGSAVSDATRETGGTLGVAVLGSIFTFIYAHHLASTSVATLPHHLATAARQSVGAAYAAASHVATPSASHQLITDINASFMNGLQIACLVAAAITGLGALAALLLPGRHSTIAAQRKPVLVTAAPEPALA